MASSKSPGSLSSSAPLRRSHTKSRKGCAQCKHSHRKCDEVFPTCAICRKRGIKCSLEATSTLDSASSKEREPLIPWVQELDLFHFFTMNTAETFSRTHDLDVWQEALPQQACRHGFLLDGILAAACSQRATLCDARTMHWTENAINYQNRALQQFKPALGSLNADNCHATFAFALLTMCTAFSLLDSDCTNQISALQGIREYLLGISIISMQVGQELRAGPLRALFQDSDGKDLSMFWESNTPENRDWYVNLQPPPPLVKQEKKSPALIPNPQVTTRRRTVQSLAPRPAPLRRARTPPTPRPLRRRNQQAQHGL